MSGLAERVAAVPRWYHTLELAPGVVTPGWFDLRVVAERLPWPDLQGKRCLDVGTYDGFWAFEMERRGAAAVVAADVLDPSRWDWPADSPPEAIERLEDQKGPNRGFEIARDALGSGVELIDRSIYELDPETDGRFDVVYVGSLLLHLRDPIGALERVRAVCEERLLVVEAVDPELELVSRRRPLAQLDGRGRPWWWKANRAGVKRIVEAAGFELLDGPRRVGLPYGEGGPDDPWRSLAAITHKETREIAYAHRFGDPHAALLCRPR